MTNHQCLYFLQNMLIMNNPYLVESFLITLILFTSMMRFKPLLTNFTTVRQKNPTTNKFDSSWGMSLQAIEAKTFTLFPSFTLPLLKRRRHPQKTRTGKLTSICVVYTRGLLTKYIVNFTCIKDSHFFGNSICVKILSILL